MTRRTLLTSFCAFGALTRTLLLGCRSTAEQERGAPGTVTTVDPEGAAREGQPAGPYDSYGGYGPVVESSTPTTPPVTPTPSGASATGTVSPASVVIEVRVVNFGFEPASIEVAAGTRVVWRNESPTTHTVTAKDGSFDSGLLEPGRTYEVVLERPGTHEYWCLLHPEMVGRVTVR